MLIDKCMNIRRKLAEARRSMTGYPSYSGAGEDRLVMAWLSVVAGLKLSDVRYCDIGANHPKMLNNTFALYRCGARGILVEPDPRMCSRLRRSRPRDTVMNVGAAFDERQSAMLRRLSNSVFNTFLTDQSDRIVRDSKNWQPHQHQTVIDEIEVPLLSMNELLEKSSSLDFLSIDTEGCNLQIVQSIDFDRFRPKIICIEVEAGVESILQGAGFELLARTPDNVIYRAIR